MSLMSLLDLLTVIVSAAVIIVYLMLAYFEPEDLEPRDALMLAWALFSLLRVVIVCW